MPTHKKPEAAQAPENFVFSKDGSERGHTNGGRYRCSMEGCTGVRLTVRWPDKKITRPCTKGMIVRDDGSWQIG